MKWLAATLLLFVSVVSGCGWNRPAEPIPVMCCPSACNNPCTPVVVQAPSGCQTYTTPAPR